LFVIKCRIEDFALEEMIVKPSTEEFLVADAVTMLRSIDPTFYLPILPNTVGIKPRVPRTSGCIVSPKYTGSVREETPTANPHSARPINTIVTFLANAISNQAVMKNAYYYYMILGIILEINFKLLLDVNTATLLWHKERSC
jgi:hypothetical protein